MFISHASRDSWMARTLGEKVGACGAEFFLDAVDVEVGDDIAIRIREGLGRCTELLVLLTPSSVDRRWVWIEIGSAWFQGKRVIGVVQGMTVEELLKQPDLPGVLSQKHLVDINDVDRYFRELKGRVQRASRSHGR